jgi:hypothetical protein
LTSLTKLVLPLEIVLDISSICECISPCNLQLLLAKFSGRRHMDWRTQDWGALTQLSRPPHLHVGLNRAGSAEIDAYYGAIKQLKGLGSVGADCWAYNALPVLQSLTQVTAVCGSWVIVDSHAGLDVSGLVCPNVKELRETDDPDFEAFPNLESVSFSLLAYHNLQDLSRFCTALQKLTLTDGTNESVWGHSKDPI